MEIPTWESLASSWLEMDEINLGRNEEALDLDKL